MHVGHYVEAPEVANSFTPGLLFRLPKNRNFFSPFLFSQFSLLASFGRAFHHRPWLSLYPPPPCQGPRDSTLFISNEAARVSEKRKEPNCTEQLHKDAVNNFASQRCFENPSDKTVLKKNTLKKKKISVEQTIAVSRSDKRVYKFFPRCGGIEPFYLSEGRKI